MMPSDLKDERSQSRARGSSRGPIRLESMTGQNIEEMSLTKVTWARGNQQGKNLEEVLGGNFQTLNLDSLGKLNDFDVNNESGEYYNPYADEFSAHDKIYEEENELNSSTNKDDSVKLSKEESIFAKSQKNFKRD